MRADDVIVIDDSGDKVQVDVQAPEARPLSIKIEHEDIPQDPEESDASSLRWSTRNRVQRQLFSPKTKGPYHKAVGFAEPGWESRSGDFKDETPVLTTSTEESEATHDEGDSNLIGNGHLLKTLRELESIRALRGVSSQGVKDGGVDHPPRARVKNDPEKAIIDAMYQGMG